MGLGEKLRNDNLLIRGLIEKLEKLRNKRFMDSIVYTSCAAFARELYRLTGLKPHRPRINGNMFMLAENGPECPTIDERPPVRIMTAFRRSFWSDGIFPSVFRVCGVPE